MGNLNVIKDFLPPPEDLVLKDDNATLNDLKEPKEHKEKERNSF